MMEVDQWYKLSLAEQMGNIGSEISRARCWAEKGDPKNQERALKRAFELIDLTLADQRWKFRLKELTRFREIICDLMIGQNIYQSSPKAIENYCLSFGLVARKSHKI